MNRVIQPNSWSCLAACACMITGEPMEALYADVGHDGSALVADSQYADGRLGFRFCEITRYLAGRGFNLGTPTPRAAQIGNHSRFPALVIVQGPSYNHAIIWDGARVLDPSSGARPFEKLISYESKQWWPIVEITLEGQW